MWLGAESETNTDFRLPAGQDVRQGSIQSDAGEQQSQKLIVDLFLYENPPST